MPLTTQAAAVRAAVSAAADLGVACTEPVVLADGANVIVHLSPSPIVAKVAASTSVIRSDADRWLQRLERSRILAAFKDPVDTAQLDICEQLRRLHLTIWYALYAERLPRHRRQAAELLATRQTR